ncbi:MAG: efflux RND transporter periplasmic adaptor subunit [Ignavibacteriae bacterium]|nr:efflux RND transporter periplasmic adaptor subunit [Ignavibacteriota bacterium]
MNKKLIAGLIAMIVLGIVGVMVYPKIFPSKSERKILYWTDPMLPGDRSDHPGKSPMGMERIPVYADSTDNKTVQSESSMSESQKSDEYYCPMHPNEVYSKPGVCNVCGMSLVKKPKSVDMSQQEQQKLGTVTISPTKQVLANIATTVAGRMSLEQNIQAVGHIDYAEPNFRHISTRFSGRLEKLYLTYTGQNVLKGDRVADVYSPDAVSAQQEYLLSKQSYEQVKDATELISSGAQSLLEQSRQKLILWGFTEEQIAELDRTKQVKNIVTIFSPINGTVLKKNVHPQHYVAAGEDMFDVADLSTVWMYADVYEFEMRTLRVGQAVEATSDAYPGEVFKGKISFISPTVDPSTRTVQVRADFPNPHGTLKPEMYVKALIKVHLPQTVVVQQSAVLSTGNRQVVWMQKQEGVFEPRLVKTGARAGEYIQILDGINEGETVVSSGGYLIDSESELETTSGTSSQAHTK